MGNASVTQDGTPMFEMGQPCQKDWEPTPGDLNCTKTAAEVPALQVVKGTHSMQAQAADLIDGRPQGLPRGVYGGVIKSYSKEEGGLIYSKPIEEQFNCDVTFTADLLQSTGAFPIRMNDVVRFELSPHLKPGGKPQALSVSRSFQLPYQRLTEDGRLEKTKLPDHGPPRESKRPSTSRFDHDGPQPVKQQRLSWPSASALTDAAQSVSGGTSL